MNDERAYSAIIGWAWSLEVYAFFGTFAEVSFEAELAAIKKGDGALVYSLTLDPC